MSTLEYNFDLYITPNIFAPPVLNLSQYDNTRTFIAHLKDDKGQPYLLTQGAVISIIGQNKYGPFKINATYNNDTITFIPSGNATLQYGQIYTTVQLIKNEEYLTLSTIILNIQKAGIEKNKMPDEEDESGSTIVLQDMQVFLEDDGETLVFEPRSNFINTDKVGD